jgi:RNA polymerase sigma-70 factor (ECF subfamily)
VGQAEPESLNQDTSASFLADLCDQDPLAWERFVDIYGPLIYGWCRRAHCSPDVAGELLQRILIKVWAGLKTFRSADSSFRSWLAVVTRNALIDFFRSEQGKAIAPGGTDAWQRLNALPAAIERSTEILDEDVRNLALRALQIVSTTLPPESQRIFELAIVQNRPAPEVAALVNCSPAAVRKAKSRLLQKLRETLGEFG